MGFLDIFKRYQVVKTEELQEAKKGLEELKTISNYSIPEDMYYSDSQNLPPMHVLSSKITPLDLYDISLYSDIIRNVFNSLKIEIFRNGFNIEALSEDASENQKKKAEALIYKANNSGQGLLDVLMEIEEDLNVFDNAYLYVAKNYFLNDNDEIIGGEISEVVRLNPLTCMKVMDKRLRLGYNDEGERVYFDLHNRSMLHTEEYDEQGRKRLRACFKVVTGDGKNDCLYYDRNEVLHVSKYRPSRGYGFSNLYSLYNKVMILMNQDYYIRQYYSGNKVPKGLFLVNTSNTKSFLAMWNKFIEKVRKNPHEVHPVICQTESSNPAQFINFMNNLQEMQYTEVRNEIRQQIGALYNVSPIFQNDVSTAGGLNNEGLQITVTNRGVEMGQRVYNDKVLPFIFKTNMGLTQIEVTLNPSEEQDDMHERELKLKDAQIAKAFAELGIKTSLERDGTFSYKEGEVKLQQTAEPFIPFQNEKADVIVETPVKLSKASKLPKKDVKQFETALEKELKAILKQLDLSKKPSEKELKNIVDKVSKNFEKRLNAKSANMIKAIYNKSKKLVEKEVGEKLSLTEKDRNVIEALKRDPIYRKAFAGLTDDMSNKLKEVITNAYDKEKGFTINQLTKELQSTLKESTGRLRTIARTETSKISVAARKVQYEKTGVEYKYKHIGPNDNRTSEVSKRVVERTKNGVTWDEYVNIIKEETKKFNPKWVVNEQAPITHPNTRHTFIAVRS
jgi:hypothetical protein